MPSTSRSPGRGLALALLVLPGILAVAPAKEIEMVMPGPINVSQVQFSDRLHGVAMGIHAKNTPGSAIVWSDDGGDTWKDAAIRGDVDGAEPESLFLIDRQVGWALMCGLNPRRQILLKSEDGGKSWKQQAAPDLEKAWVLSQIWFDHQGKCGWINTCSGPLLATSDGARSWKPVEVARYENGPFLAEGKPLPPTFEHAGMHVFSLEHVILGGYAGVILQSTDAGRTWKGRQVRAGTKFRQTNACLAPGDPFHRGRPCRLGRRRRGRRDPEFQQLGAVAASRCLLDGRRRRYLAAE